MDDIVEYQEKMSTAHRQYFCQMLKMEQLPECLLEHYARVKKLADRIDGFLSPGELALIAVMVGFDPDKGIFCVTEQVVDRRPTLDKEAAEKEAAIAADATAKPVGILDEVVDKKVEKILEPPIEQPIVGATGQAQEQPAAGEVKDFDLAEAKGEKPAASGKLWALGMPVDVLHEDELKRGKIFAVHLPAEGSGDATQLTVEFEGEEAITVDEDKVEAA